MANSQRIISEDELQNKIYDSQLFKRLICYLKPYKWPVFLSFFLLIFIAGAQLITPIITMRAVDDVILSNRELIIFETDEEREDFKQRYERIKYDQYTWGGRYCLVISHRHVDFIDPLEYEEYEEQSRLYKNVMFVDKTESNLALLPSGDIFILSEDEIAIPRAKLEELYQEGEITRSELRQLRSQDLSDLRIYGAVFLLVIIMQMLFTYYQVSLINHASQHAMFDLRRDVYAHILRMPLSFFDRNPIGRLVTRVTNDIRTLDEMLSNGLIQLLQEFAILFGIMIMMLVLDWKLALVCFSILPFLTVLVIYFNRQTRIIYRKVRKRLARINATLSEDISGVKIIQLFNQNMRKIKEFAEINYAFYKASMEQLKLFAVFRPIINSSRRVAVAILLWYGGGQILQNNISLGLFIAFMNYVDRFFEPINQLSERFNIFQAAMSGTERVFDLMDKSNEDYRVENTENVQLKGEIEFKNVWLRYNEGENDDGYVLKDISFKVNPGEKVALVGHTGSGKTSIINLIAGMYPFQKGKILLDGKDIHEYSLDDLRRNIGIVQQDVFLFSGTIRDNIVLNKGDITDARLKQVANYVNVHHFIEDLPGRYEEPVMERGATFSVGQRQLIAFARVLAYDPAIFILDEATSNIDTETEILIQDALKKLMEGRTSIIIAHRLSTIQHVDRIIVLHKGKIIEEGSHQQLLDNKGLYYDLYRLQYT